jgi:hypothetical protein
MKKLIAFCIVALSFSLGATAQTTKQTQKADTRIEKKKTLKYKVLKAVHSKKTQAHLQKANSEMKKDGE